MITVPPIYGGEKVIGEGGVMLGITYDYPMTSTSSSSTTTVVSDATVSTSATTAMQPAADLSLTDYQDYIIQTGDNLTNIARRCRVSVNELKVWNGLGDDKIFVGQKIVISDPYKGQSGKYSDLIASKGSDDKSGDDYRDMQMPTAERLKENYVPIYRRTDETQPESYDSRVKPRLVTGKGSGNGGGGDTYTVQKGETIYGLSRRFGMTQEQFRNLNNLGESDLLKVGQVIRIKSIVTKGGSNVEVAPQSYDMRVRPSSQSASNGKQYYEVQPNETISTVARKFGMTVERLRSLNNMTDNEIAVPYQRLMVE